MHPATTLNAIRAAVLLVTAVLLLAIMLPAGTVAIGYLTIPEGGLELWSRRVVWYDAVVLNTLVPIFKTFIAAVLAAVLGKALVDAVRLLVGRCADCSVAERL